MKGLRRAMEGGDTRLIQRALRRAAWHHRETPSIEIDADIPTTLGGDLEEHLALRSKIDRNIQRINAHLKATKVKMRHERSKAAREQRNKQFTDQKQIGKVYIHIINKYSQLIKIRKNKYAKI